MSVTVTVTRDPYHAMRHTVRVRAHDFPGEDSGLELHQLYAAALDARKAPTTPWDAIRRAIRVESIKVTIRRDACAPREAC